MSSKKACGKHSLLIANSAIRVTRCACGAVYMTVIASGVTVRVSDSTLREMASGLTAAVGTLDASTHAGTSTIN